MISYHHFKTLPDYFAYLTDQKRYCLAGALDEEAFKREMQYVLEESLILRNKTSFVFHVLASFNRTKKETLLAGVQVAGEMLAKQCELLDLLPAAKLKRGLFEGDELVKLAPLLLEKLIDDEESFENVLFIFGYLYDFYMTVGKYNGKEFKKEFDSDEEHWFNESVIFENKVFEEIEKIFPNRIHIKRSEADY